MIVTYQSEVKEDQKQCSLCSLHVAKENIETYPLFFADGAFHPMSNQVFCSKKCVKRYLIANETFLHTLYSLYLLQIHGISELKPAPDPLTLKYRQIEPHPTLSLTFVQFHQCFQDVYAFTNHGIQCSLCFYWFHGPPKTFV